MDSRREFLKFTGRATGLALLSRPLQLLAATRTDMIRGIAPTDIDDVVLADGLDWYRLITWGDVLNNKQQRFGFNNDYTAFIPLDAGDEALLWVNHEDLGPCYYPTPNDPAEKSREDVRTEMREVGGSILRLQHRAGRWHYVVDDSLNRRLDALTDIPLVTDEHLQGSSVAKGTLGNCAGGVTPWHTVLSCEENYQHFFGEVDFSSGRRQLDRSESINGWHRYLDHPPEHYGWVVEIDPLTGAARKLTALGRFAHEGACVVETANGLCVVYMGDDEEDECVYKFVADQPASLQSGTLYAANMQSGRWLPLHIEANAGLSSAFATQTELLVRTREAARIVGATPLDRPEDIERDPLTGAVYIACTKNRGKPFGSILKLLEKDNDPLATQFHCQTFRAGGEESGFACPDNMVFDRQGNLWLTTDVSSEAQNRPPYASFKNNGLFYIPMSGPQQGEFIQVASAPAGAELTGPSFSADGRTLFLSVQHPGDGEGERLQSSWPDRIDGKPKPAVICIHGPLLDRCCAA